MIDNPKELTSSDTLHLNRVSHFVQIRSIFAEMNLKDIDTNETDYLSLQQFEEQLYLCDSALISNDIENLALHLETVIRHFLVPDHDFSIEAQYFCLSHFWTMLQDILNEKEIGEILYLTLELLFCLTAHSDFFCVEFMTTHHKSGLEKILVASNTFPRYYPFLMIIFYNISGSLSNNQRESASIFFSYLHSTANHCMVSYDCYRDPFFTSMAIINILRYTPIKELEHNQNFLSDFIPLLCAPNCQSIIANVQWCFYFWAINSWPYFKKAINKKLIKLVNKMIQSEIVTSRNIGLTILSCFWLAAYDYSDLVSLLHQYSIYNDVVELICSDDLDTSVQALTVVTNSIVANSSAVNCYKSTNLLNNIFFVGQEYEVDARIEAVSTLITYSSHLSTVEIRDFFNEDVFNFILDLKDIDDYDLIMRILHFILDMAPAFPEIIQILADSDFYECIMPIIEANQDCAIHEIFKMIERMVVDNANIS